MGTIKSEPLVSIIIVNFNGGDVFKNCLNSLSKISYSNWELIIVDNGSTDDSETLPRNFQFLISNFQLIKNKENVGFAKANNQGFARSKGKYILLLNNDTKVNPGFLKYLVSRMEADPSLGVVQPKLKIMDDPKLLDNSGAFLTKSGFLQHWGYLAKDGSEFNREKEVFSTKGACMLIRRNVIAKVGLFDEDFVSYMEETDFCWRVWLFGYRVVFLPQVYIFHKVGFTSKRENQIYINYHSFKNRIISLIKNLEFQNFLLIGGFHLFFISMLSVYYLIRLQFDKTFMICKAVGWNLLNIQKTLIKRKEIQKLRKISDSEIFKKIIHKINWRVMFQHFAKVEANF